MPKMDNIRFENSKKTKLVKCKRNNTGPFLNTFSAF